MSSIIYICNIYDMGHKTNQMTRHHILPRSQGGSDDYDNIKMLKWNKHNALHTIFDNDTPREQLIRLLCNINATALTVEFQNDIMKILQETDDRYYYKDNILLKKNDPIQR